MFSAGLRKLRNDLMKLTKALFVTVATTSGVLALGNLATAAETPTNAVPTRPPTSVGTNRFQMPNRMQMLTTRLQLTEDQQAKVKPIMEADQKARGEFPANSKTLTPEQRRTKYFEMQDDLDAKLKPILTAEQYQKWQSMRPRRPGTTPGAAPGTAPATAPVTPPATPAK